MKAETQERVTVSCYTMSDSVRIFPVGSKVKHTPEAYSPEVFWNNSTLWLVYWVKQPNLKLECQCLYSSVFLVEQV